MAQLTLLIATTNQDRRARSFAFRLDADGHTIHEAQDTASVVHDRTLPGSRLSG